MFRVFDSKGHCWVRDCIYLDTNDDLTMIKNTLFGTKKMSLASEHRYIYQRDIGLLDKKGNLIFEGDICSTKSNDIMGVIAYVPEHASYYLLDDRTMKYYPLWEERCKQLEVIGNIFENKDLLPVSQGKEGESHGEC